MAAVHVNSPTGRAYHGIINFGQTALVYEGQTIICLLLRHCETHSLEQTGCKLVMSEGSYVQQRKAQLDFSATGGGQDAQLPAMIFHHTGRNGEAKPAARAAAGL